MDDGQHGIGVFAAVLDDRVVAEAVGEAAVALQTISDDAGAGLGCAADKAAQIRRDGGRQDGDAGAAGDKVALLDVWHYPGANSLSRRGEEGNLLALHPTVKPVAMVADAILDCSARGDIVLDGFLGSGTTVIPPSAPAGAATASSSIPPMSIRLSAAGRR